jgi:hypothetical protein
MAEMYAAKHRREDGVEPAPILDLAVLTRRTNGSTHTRAAVEEAAR